MTDEMRDLVFASCDRAVENGYAMSPEFMGDIYNCDPALVADDMLDCDASFEHWAGDHAAYEELIHAVVDWQLARRPK